MRHRRARAIVISLACALAFLSAVSAPSASGARVEATNSLSGARCGEPAQVAGLLLPKRIRLITKYRRSSLA